MSVDAAANLWLRREGTDPQAAPVVTGSHMDTQPNGGRFDGIYGVIAGLEALTALHDVRHGIAPPDRGGGLDQRGRRPLRPWLHGQHVVERFPPHRGFCRRGRSRMACASATRSRRISPARPTCRRGRLGGQPHAYVEAHIEQGPRLEAEELDIGVVTGIQGSRWFTVTLTGETAHAGTTPLALRRDAVQDMVRAIAALNTLMHDPQDVLRFTVGRIVVEPNTSNSVANRASFTIDFRHPDKDVLLARGDAIAGVVQAAVRDAGVTVQETFHALPVEFAPLVIDAVERAATQQRRGHMRLPSGAFHDAQFVVPVCPTGMIFVPCRKGISHNPAEYSEPSQLAAGTCVLTQTLTELASS